MLPLAFDTGDLVGLLVLIIAAIASAFHKGSPSAGEEEEPAAPVRRAPTLPSPTVQPPAPGPAPAANPEEEMRRFLESLRQASGQPPVVPTAAAPATTQPPQPTWNRPRPGKPPMRRAQTPPALPRSSRPSPRRPPPVTAQPAETIEGPARSEIHEEVARSMRAIGEDVGFTTGELTGGPSPAPAPSVESPDPVVSSVRSMLHPVSNLRTAIVLTEILGRPRGW